MVRVWKAVDVCNILFWLVFSSCSQNRRAEMTGGHPENTVLMQGFAASNFYKSLQRAFPGKLWLFFPVSRNIADWKKREVPLFEGRLGFRGRKWLATTFWVWGRYKGLRLLSIPGSVRSKGEGHSFP